MVMKNNIKKILEKLAEKQIVALRSEDTDECAAYEVDLLESIIVDLKDFERELRETQEVVDADLACFLKEVEGIPLEDQEVGLRIAKAVKFAIGEFIAKLLGEK